MSSAYASEEEFTETCRMSQKECKIFHPTCLPVENTLENVENNEMKLTDSVYHEGVEHQLLMEWEDKIDNNFEKKFGECNEEVKDQGIQNSSSLTIEKQPRRGILKKAKKPEEQLNGKEKESIEESRQEESFHECCKKKRKRCEINSSNYGIRFQGTGLTCVGILPGIGSYVDSSDDSDLSCSSASDGNENVKYDLVGRRIVYECKDVNR